MDRVVPVAVKAMPLEAYRRQLRIGDGDATRVLAAVESVAGIVPFTGAEPTTGDYEIFADGFAGQVPLMERDDATYRPSGAAQGPDGSLYIANDQTGRIWRVVYQG